MKKLRINAKIDSKGHLKLDIPTHLHKGDGEIVLVIEEKKENNTYYFSDLSGKLKWNGNALEIQKALRNEW